MATPYLAAFFVGVTFFSTMTGGLFTLKNTRIPIKFFFAFAAGALLGVSFFDLMPELFSLITEANVPVVYLMGSIVIAFLFFHALDRAVVIHAMKPVHFPYGMETRQEKALLTNGMIRAAGLSTHSFLDGVAIGTAFHIGFQLGVVVGLAVVFHDFSDGLNTVTVMLRAGSTRKTAFSWLLTDSITPVIGALTTFVITLSTPILAVMLAFFVGEFLFIGASDLLPEAHQKGSSLRLVLATTIGVLLIFGVTRFLNL